MFSAWVSRRGRGSCRCWSRGAEVKVTKRQRLSSALGTDRAFPGTRIRRSRQRRGGRRLLCQRVAALPAPALPSALRARRISWLRRQASAPQETSLLSEEYFSPVTRFPPVAPSCRVTGSQNPQAVTAPVYPPLRSPGPPLWDVSHREQPVRDAESQAPLDPRTQHLAVGSR